MGRWRFVAFLMLVGRRLIAVVAILLWWVVARSWRWWWVILELVGREEVRVLEVGRRLRRVEVLWFEPPRVELLPRRMRVC